MKSEEKINNIRKSFETGTFTCAQVENLGYNRTILKLMLERGIVKKASRGVYVFSGVYNDEEYIFQLQYKSTVFSKDSALYLLGYLLERPENVNVTVGVGYNCEKFKTSKVTITKVSEKYFDIGLTKTITYSGNTVRLYNIERTICDIIRTKNYPVSKISSIMKKYINSKNYDKDKLLSYAKIFRIIEKVNTYINILTIV